MRPRLLPLFFLASLFTAAPALAQPDLPTAAVAGQVWVVITNDGSTYVGNLVENVVGSHVTMRLATGELHRFEAPDIKRQGPGGRTNPVREMPPATPKLPTVYAGPNAVSLHISGDGTLFREGASGWVPVCNVPCTTTVDPNGMYKIGGGEWKDSSPFHLPPGQTAVDLKSKGAAVYGMGSMMTGIMLLSFGPIPIVPGALLLSGAFDGPPPESGPAPSHTGEQIAGGLLIGAGVILTCIGVYYLVARPSTSVETTNGESLAKRKTPGGIRLTPQGLVF